MTTTYRDPRIHITNTEFYDAMMKRVIDAGAFRRLDEREILGVLPSYLTPPDDPTEHDEVMNTKAWQSYPYRLKNYENECYQAFRAWNRKCLEEMNITELNHLSWLFGKMDSGTLELMDEEVGSCARAYRFFVTARKTLVLTNAR